MFSFGTIKYNTAFFGSVNVIRESASTGQNHLLSAKMEAIQSCYTELSVEEYKKKIKTTFLLKYVLHTKTLVKAADYYFRFQRADLEDFFVSKMRGFPPNDNFLERFRIKPNAPLLRNIATRLRDYTDDQH